METLIYIALFGILMSGAVVTTYELLEGGDRNQSSFSIQEEGTFLNRKINWALTGASAVTVTGVNTLTITRPDLGLQSPLVIVGNGTTITITRGASVAVQLNSDAFTITNVVSSLQPANQGRPPSITTSFLVKDKPFIFRKYLRQ